MHLYPRYSGNFEVFINVTGRQFARLVMGNSYIWFAFNYENESYESLEFEGFDPAKYGYTSTTELLKRLEEAYQGNIRWLNRSKESDPQPIVTTANQALSLTKANREAVAERQADEIVRGVLEKVSKAVSTPDLIVFAVTFDTENYLADSVQKAKSQLEEKGFKVEVKRQGFYELGGSDHIYVSWGNPSI